MKTLLSYINYVRKAVTTGAAVLVAISVVDGVPTDVKAVIAHALAALAASGLTYKVSNGPEPV